MKGILLLTVVYLLRCEGAVVIRCDEQYEHPIVNARPIIGILSQELSNFLHTKYPNYTSYIASSYVKDVEKSGARVVPVLIGKERSYYEELLGKINGVYFPGGSTCFNQSNGYADAGQYILDIAKELNDAGDYFPLFGTCLGFQLLLVLASGREPDIRISCNSVDNLPLNFTQDFRKSKLFKDAQEDVIKLLKNKDVTVNHHQFCVIDEDLKKFNISKEWRPTSHSDDLYGLEFIASVENIRYPFYGVQFHPEKSSFEWKASMGYAHSIDAVKVNRYFMDFFVSECRRSTHAFASQAEENKYVIYNYEPRFTGALGGAFLQCYLFEPRLSPKREKINQC